MQIPRVTSKTFAILVVILVVVAAACTSGDDSMDVTTTAAGAMTTTTFAGDFADEEGRFDAGEGVPPASGEEPADGSTGGVVPIAQTVAGLGRDIIYRAQLTVAVADVAAAGRDAAGVIESLGGYLFGQETRGGPDPESVLTFKIAPDAFQEALARLGDMGEIRSQTITADDVTERIVDLESRIITAEASVDRLRGFLANATDVESVAELERELLDRETQLETLRGQLRTLENQVALATIVLVLTEQFSDPVLALDVTAYPGHDGDGGSCPGEHGPVVDAGEETTVCFEIANLGDTPLGQFTLTDTVLDLELADLIAVFGDPAGTLEPGETMMLAAEITPERDLRTRTRVTATPLTEDGQPFAGRTLTETVTLSIATADPGGLPGFGDGLEASWDVLRNIAGIIVVAAGWVIPFLWVLVLAGLAVWWLRRRDATTAPTPPPDSTEAPGA